MQLVVVGEHVGSRVSPGWYGKACTGYTTKNVATVLSTILVSTPLLSFTFSKCIPKTFATNLNYYFHSTAHKVSAR